MLAPRTCTITTRRPGLRRPLTAHTLRRLLTFHATTVTGCRATAHQPAPTGRPLNFSRRIQTRCRANHQAQATDWTTSPLPRLLYSWTASPHPHTSLQHPRTMPSALCSACPCLILPRRGRCPVPLRQAPSVLTIITTTTTTPSPPSAALPRRT